MTFLMSLKAQTLAKATITATPTAIAGVVEAAIAVTADDTSIWNAPYICHRDEQYSRGGVANS
ncbi:MAG: hypothetical protein EAZ43_11725 [Betaproteobacteria bacterium]|nr:MAG: hypothetical protein EAZ43_11725 [Betaproteobacteria bacterium]